MEKSYVPFWILIFSFLIYTQNYILLAFLLIFQGVLYFCFEFDRKCPPNEFKVAIIGAGFSGLAMARKLANIGVNYQLFECEKAVGGTWFYNVYPGCACDIQSHLYSFSFDLNPGWTRKYPPQLELWRYLDNVMHKFGIKVNFGKKVTQVRWDSTKLRYSIMLNDGTTQEANAVVHCAGILREVQIPEFRGQENFKKPAFHSAQFDRTVDLSGKRVGVIGTGASAVQIVPSICDKVAQLYVFQRTPGWSNSKNDQGIPDLVKFLFKFVPGLMYAYRLGLFVYQELTYRAFFRTNAPMGPHFRANLQKHMERTIQSPELRKKMIPDYLPGCKRITPSDDYLQSFARPNVHLITDGIEEFTSRGVRTRRASENAADASANGTDASEIELDVVIYATGFSPIKSLTLAYDTYNSEGEKLSKILGTYPSAHLGVSVPQFPNYFIIMGPHAGLGHNSMVWMAECQVNYVGNLIKNMIKRRIAFVQVKQSVLAEFQRLVNDYMQNKVFYKGCFSWYKADEGKGENYVLWPSHLLHFWWLTFKAGLEDYDISKSEESEVRNIGKS